MPLTPTVELEVPGLRLLHPPEAEIETGTTTTRRHRVRKVHVRGPWITSASEPGVGTRYDVRILIFEDPAGGSVEDPVAEGRLKSRPGRYELVAGTLGGREAVIRRPLDVQQVPRAAYVKGDRRFFFVEWKGPVDEILETLELDG